MSTVDAQKFEQIVASFKNNFSVLSASGNTVGDGVLISSGISVMEQFDEYFNTAYDVEGSEDAEIGSEGASESDMANQLAEQYSDEAISEAFNEQGLKESERMAQEIESLAEKFGIRQQMEVTFNGEYVEITLNGALLFDSGEAVVSPEGTALMDKLGAIIDNFNSNIVEIEAELFDSYSKIKSEFHEDKLGYIVGNDGLEEAVNSCDAYYGSGGIAMNRCVNRGIPVMVRNIEI